MLTAWPYALRRRLFGVEPPPVVPVVRLAGIIGALSPLRPGLSLAGLAPLLERAFRWPGAKAVAIAINSPGGSAAQSSLIHNRIRALAAERKLKVHAFVEDVAASGGYWLACAGDEIHADETSIVGSIGVVSAGFGFHELIERWGIERRVHTAGERKTLLDPFRPEDPDDVVRLKRIQAEIHDQFKDMVRARRGAKLKASEEDLFTGDVWTGAKAVELGLVDGLGDLRTVLRARYGEKVRLRLVAEGRRWFPKGLRLGADGGGGGAGGGGADGLDWAGGAARGLVAAIEERALWARFGL